MKTQLQFLFTSLALLAGVCQINAQVTNPVLISFSQNGMLVCTNLQPGSVVSVQWASSLAGPWQSDWAALKTLGVGSNGSITVSVPMFYRVLEVAAANAAPAGMVQIPAGSFTMGDTLDNLSDAIPTNTYLSQFYMDTNLVTYGFWKTVYTNALSKGYGFDDAGSGKATNHPVHSVNWYDCVKWSNARSQLAGLTPVYYLDAAFTQVYTNGDTNNLYVKWNANGYRLPTEAEWEKAARGGVSGQRFPWGNTISENQANYYTSPSPNPGSYIYDLGPYTGYNTNYTTGGTPYTSPVGSFPANGYGLNDMAGNIYEWCWDWYGTPYGQPTTSNPTGAGPGSGTRVLRGGDWGFGASYARCAYRFNIVPVGNGTGVGFRCVCAF